MAIFSEHRLFLVFVASLIWYAYSVVSFDPKERERIEKLSFNEHFQIWLENFVEVLIFDIFYQHICKFLE